MMNRTRGGRWACVWLAVLGVVNASAFAKSDTTAMYFWGDQSDGILSGVDFTCPSIWKLYVGELTTDIRPASGVCGIRISYQAPHGAGGSWAYYGGNGGDGGVGGYWYTPEDVRPEFAFDRLGGPSVTFGDEDSSIMTTGAGAHGIRVSGIAGDGGNGSHDGGFFSALGGHGGNGGNGGPASVNSNAQIQTDGASAYGILAESLGGRGGNGGDAGSAIYAEGGDGGRGGNGGAVTVISSGHIITRGESSDAIVGQSLGGAGGSGGVGGSAAGQGGGALGSGPGSAVTITNNGIIETVRKESRGIYAQSVGGFAAGAGGGGGVVGWGGNSNSAGDGGAVTVTNNGTITTAGKDSDGIYAQSIGGGGGRATASGGLVGIGGSGAAGGHGQAVTITNTGQIKTTGDESRGILAQSVGGGGGSGGSSGGAFSIGGNGKATGNGGAVAVTNSGSISTGAITDKGVVTGHGSDAIFAQSAGGGGGVTGGSGGSANGFFMSIGGDGDSGGNGASVTVHNSGALKTFGIDASGILAQSLGGGGGNGGQAYDIGLGFTHAAGGNSALGGNGGQVTVTGQSASIETAGALSHGIHAASYGGGGGTGGNVLNVVAGAQFTASYTAGGRGGGGGAGGNVTANSAGRIETRGDNAYGVFAESVGGGGGAGGNVISWVANMGVVDQMPAISANIALGGTGGKGGDGEIVRAGSTGDIDTYGAFGYGLFAQSVGGGGGAGGNVLAGSLAIESINVTLSAGGAGGGAGHGKLVDVDNGGTIDTRGDFAYGILAQSVGGGGGAGGNSTTLSLNFDMLDSLEDLLPTPGGTMTVSLGGRSGGGGNGGIVDVHNTGAISTQGEFAHGILAQSIGGGGGSGGNVLSINVEPSMNPLDYVECFDVMSFDSDLLIGGKGGSGGNGVGVTVHNHSTIETQGNFAAGILAQSIGGGGGSGGSARSRTYGLASSDDSSMRLYGGSGGRGTGGDVTVENSGNIITHGGFAHGILAQSIGGGGGFAGISEVDGVSALALGGRGISTGNRGFGVGFAGSVGGSGSAGAVNVTHTGSITTYGDVSHGIFAQSAAGSGTAGPVTITLGSEIFAHGADSDGIHAQSVGGAGNGNISITIGGGTVQGGSGAGAGVRIDGGAANSLTNRGVLSALSGTAIVGGVRNEAIHNFGAVTGSVNLGSGVNSFHNYEGATFNTGAIIDLGQENDLINSGVLAIGGSGVIGDTLLDGDLIQTDSGIIEVDVAGFGAGMFDTLDVTGTMTGGKVRFSFLSCFDVTTLGLDEYETASIPFLTCDSLDGFRDALSCSYVGRVMGFQYGVYEQSGALYLRITNGIPAPSALLLVSIGLGALRLRRRRGL